MSIVSIAACKTYELDAARQAVESALAPLGGVERFVRPGMRVLLKPNLLLAAEPERGITTHPAVVQAVVELVQAAGASVLIGDSPAGSLKNGPRAWRACGMGAVAERTGAQLTPFDHAVWKRVGENDYFIARPVLEADLVINLPKLKTHMLTLYTGAVKNLYGVVPGVRKREVHYRAPGVQDFSRVLPDILELVRPALTIMDGVLGLEGHGPGVMGEPRSYGCIAASADAVALDAVLAQAMGFRRGEVLHINEAGARGLGASDPAAAQTVGEREALEFGRVRLPTPHWFLRAPAWAAAPLRRIARVRPRVDAAACIGCGACSEVCPQQIIARGKPPQIDLRRCIGCLCCAESCPRGAIEPRRNFLARMVGIRD